MSRDPVYPHSATLWRKGSEAARKAVWTRVSVSSCHFESIRGARRTSSGDASQDSALFLIPDASLSMRDHDRIAFGTVLDEVPTSDAFEIVCVEPVYLDGFDHWEVTAQ